MLNEIKKIGFDFEIDDQELNEILSEITSDELNQLEQEIKAIANKYILEFSEFTRSYGTKKTYSQPIYLKNECFFIEYSGEPHEYKKDELDNFYNFCFINLLHDFINFKKGSYYNG